MNLQVGRREPFERAPSKSPSKGFLSRVLYKGYEVFSVEVVIYQNGIWGSLYS